MGRERNGQVGRRGAGALLGLLGLGLLTVLGGCSANTLSMASLKTDLFGSSATHSAKAAGVTDADAEAVNDAPCPEVKVLTGASTLMIGDKRGPGEPSPMDVRYQGSILRTARECHLNAGLLTIKVGVEGRIITGPAGGPGTVNVPLRIAVVHQTINPTTLVSKFAMIPVTVTNAVDRVTFTHVEPDLAFPLPTGSIDNYVVFVGFDPRGAELQKRPGRRKHVRRRARR